MDRQRRRSSARRGDLYEELCAIHYEYKGDKLKIVDKEQVRDELEGAALTALTLRLSPSPTRSRLRVILSLLSATRLASAVVASTTTLWRIDVLLRCPVPEAARCTGHHAGPAVVASLDADRKRRQANGFNSTIMTKAAPWLRHRLRSKTLLGS